jgi:hypothetical protein
MEKTINLESLAQNTNGNYRLNALYDPNLQTPV